MTLLANKRIILGISGGIAAYKSAFLLRELCKLSCTVKVVVTEAAKAFITPLTLQALSGNEVRDDMFDASAEKAMSHIELARWAEMIIIAPATADIIARLTHGLADNLLSTLCLASTAPLVIVPAMNQQMWLHPATQRNVTDLLQRGVTFLGPDQGYQACGEHGPGRMLEPEEIIKMLGSRFNQEQGLLSNRKVLITAGPTQEAIDPVRYLTNHSSGKMGYALAKIALDQGAEVTLVSGPTNLACDARIKLIKVVTAEQMYQTVHEQINSETIFIGAAAVADYRCATISPQKIKKFNQSDSMTTISMTLSLIANPDILASVANLKPRPALIVGFAAETENLIENARHKLTSKKLDVIIANNVNNKHPVFNSDYNSVEIITADEIISLPLTEKTQIAYQIIKFISQQIREKNNDS